MKGKPSMYITPILPTLYINNTISNNTPSVQHIKSQYSHPLSADTVSFKAGKKDFENMKDAVSVESTRKAIDEATAASKRTLYILRKYLKPLMANTANPNNPIKSISGGVKGENSTRKKTAKRSISGKRGLMEMGDFIRYRITLRDNSPKSIEKVLKQLGNAVKSGEFQIFEIENYLTQDSRGYANFKMLSALTDNCNPNELSIRTANIPSGYPAIHIGFRTKEDIIGEIQIMGSDVEEIKELDDFLYKLLDNNGLEEPYKGIMEAPMKKALKSIKDDAYKMNALMQYRRDSFSLAFDTPSKKYNSKEKVKYIDIPYFLPKELGFPWIAEQKEFCESVSKKSDTIVKKEKSKINTRKTTKTK